jgi:hypothetical protein
MKNKDVKKLIETYDNYLKFLNMANNAPCSIAYAHGWKCPDEDIEKGIAFRKEIQELKHIIEGK